MMTPKLLRVALATASAALSLVSVLAISAKAEEYYFTIQNNTDLAISQVFVSEDGTNWGYFTLKSNIAPKTEGEMTWGENTNHEACSQWIKVGFENGDVTKPAKFDFCQNPSLVVD
ncbi:hypothetical protein BCD67_15305 [Oscillatoriales cyanobacterium USR001]|nr:hypothetical protein BCD67_15305 [Oscillatoriales cyanobacterium USR001]